MRTTRAMLLTLLVLAALAGCTDASNPVGLDSTPHRLADLRAMTDVTDQLASPGRPYILVSEGDFNFAQVSKSRGHSTDRESLTGHISYQASVSYVPGQSGEGMLKYHDSKGQYYMVEVRQVRIKKDGALLLGGPVLSSHLDLKVPVWFFAQAYDRGPHGQGDLFSYRLDAPWYIWKEEGNDLIDLVVVRGDLTVHQAAF